MLPLSMANKGETHIIRKISGDNKVRQHLSELGFVVDEELTIVNEMAGNLIVKVKDTRIALGIDLAKRIFI